MRASEILREAKKKSYSWDEEVKARKELAKIFVDVYYNNLQVTPELLKQVKNNIAVVGRRGEIPYTGPKGNYSRVTVRNLASIIMDKYYEQSKKSGKLPAFVANLPTAKDMASQIAAHTNGSYTWRNPTTWTTGYGQRYRDPEDHIRYKTEEDYEDAWEFLSNLGTKVYYRDSFKSLRTAIKIGKFIVEQASTVMGVFGDDPVTTHMLSVRTAGVINKAVRTQVAISDQEANTLKDIAATKSKDNMEAIKLMISWMKSKNDVEAALKAVADSSKLDANVKATIDKIVAGAKDFKEKD